MTADPALTPNDWMWWATLIVEDAFFVAAVIAAIALMTIAKYVKKVSQTFAEISQRDYESYQTNQHHLSISAMTKEEASEKTDMDRYTVVSTSM